MSSRKSELSEDKKNFTFEGEKIHYKDEGSGPVILFVHGTPSSSFEWRMVIEKVKSRFRCIAPDLSGFGESEKTGNRNYPLTRHSEMLQALMDYLSVREFWLTAHDFGGPISMNAFAEKPESIKGILLLNTWLLDPREDKHFAKGIRILRSPITPFLYMYFNFSASVLLPAAFAPKYKPSAEVLRKYRSFFPDVKSRAGTLAFAKNLLHDGDFFKKAGLAARKFTEIKPDLPVRILWGTGDRLLPPSLKEHLKYIFPAASLTENDSGHFPAEETPEDVIREIGILTGTEIMEK